MQEVNMKLRPGLSS